jgi:hypothetical protein
MSKCCRTVALGVALLVAIGCDSGERISRLEKQTEELKAAISKDRSAVDYDLQAKCSRDAKAWFNDNQSSDKTVLPQLEMEKAFVR